MNPRSGTSGHAQPAAPRGGGGRVAIAALLLVAATGAVLLAMGRVPICTCGYVKLWEGDPASPGNSQHLFDWYTPSHLIHGFLFWLAARWALGRRSPGFRFLAALLVEGAWEIAENTDAVIERYRAATVSLHYYGDSVLNSMSDIGAMAVGFWLAARAPVWLTVALAVGFEILTAIVIRDNLALNVLMLLYPVDAVRNWQAAL